MSIDSFISTLKLHITAVPSIVNFGKNNKIDFMILLSYYFLADIDWKKDPSKMALIDDLHQRGRRAADKIVSLVI